MGDEAVSNIKKLLEIMDKLGVHEIADEWKAGAAHELKTFAPAGIKMAMGALYLDHGHQKRGQGAQRGAMVSVI